MNRKLDELGRITIPKEMRATLGISAGDPVNISMEDNKIIITNPNKTDYKQALDEIEKYMKSIEHEPDADMYMELGEYKEFKHILGIIKKVKEGK